MTWREHAQRAAFLTIGGVGGVLLATGWVYFAGGAGTAQVDMGEPPSPLYLALMAAITLAVLYTVINGNKRSEDPQ